MFFPENRFLTFHANCLIRRQFAWNVKTCFLGKIKQKQQNIFCWIFYPVHSYCHIILPLWHHSIIFKSCYKWWGFARAKMGFGLLVDFLRTVPARFVCCSPSLCVRPWIHTWRLLCHFCTSCFLLFVIQKGCVSLLWHFLGYVFLLFKQVYYSETQFRHSRSSDIYKNTHIVMAYSYTDRNGLMAECSFKVIVKGRYHHSKALLKIPSVNLLNYVFKRSVEL